MFRLVKYAKKYIYFGIIILKKLIKEKIMSKLIEYLNTQRFIVMSELKFKDVCTKPDIFNCDFNYKMVDCIFDSLEKIAEEIEKFKPKD
jgi:hypothetical protein